MCKERKEGKNEAWERRHEQCGKFKLKNHPGLKTVSVVLNGYVFEAEDRRLV